MIFCCLRVVSALERAYTSLVNQLNSYYQVPLSVVMQCDRVYFLGPYDGDGEETHVPEDTILVQEFRRGNLLRRVITYDGLEIASYDGDPFRPVRVPWVWIGDDTTDVDLTSTISKYLVPGNLITLELIYHFISVNENTRIVYVDSRTFKEHPFPAEGIRIEANEVA
jgi:hypothetical protein